MSGWSLLGEVADASVVGLLHEHELAARRRVDGLREETGPYPGRAGCERMLVHPLWFGILAAQVGPLAPTEYMQQP